MNPLYCFYKNDSVVFSDHYSLFSCGQNESVSDFLNKISTLHSAALKIVQINFEFENIALFEHQKALYPSAKASVFVLHEFTFATLPESPGMTPPVFKSLESRDGFITKVNKIKSDISSGRLYQVNLTAPLVAQSAHTPLELFLFYSQKFSGRYKALLPLNQYDIISFSPELFLEKSQGMLTTRPIKGSVSEKLNFEKDLLQSPKEEAELSMIVDLLRNDFNRIDAGKSASVTEHRKPLQLGYIQHTYSEVQIQTDKPLSALLECTLPGGSISGCPKIESLNLIAELESYRRQAYTGCLGWWQGADFTLSLSIRSFIKHQEQLIYHAGCGIVFDSVPETEWNEFILKTGSLQIEQ